MSQPTHNRPGDGADIDPLLLFATEIGTVVLPVPATEIPKKIERPAPSAELVALRTRADAAERALRESRREVAALKRQMATLVTAARDKPRAHVGRWSIVAAASLAVLIVAATAFWPTMPLPQSVVPDPERVADLEPAPVPEVATPFVPAAVPTPLPAKQVSARVPQRPEPRPTTTYYGTLSIDAVPGGEVFLNRKSVGKTPLRLSDLRAGSHLVWIQREGHRRFTRVVLVPAGKVSRVSVALEPDNSLAGRP